MAGRVGCRIQEHRRNPPHEAGRRCAVRYGFQMEAPAGDVRRSTFPTGSASCPIRTRSVSAARAHTEAFGDHWSFQDRQFDNWTPDTIDSEVFRGDLSRLVFDGDEIVAYILAYDGVESSVYIGQVGTRRPWRKRGLAGALLSDSVRAAAANGTRSAYARCGRGQPDRRGRCVRTARVRSPAQSRGLSLDGGIRHDRRDADSPVRRI